MNRPLLLAALACLTLSSKAFSQTVLNGTSVSGQVIASMNATYQVQNSAYQVNLNALYSWFGVNLSNTNWSSSTHVIVALKNIRSTPSLVTIGIDSGSGSSTAWMWSSNFIPPNETVRIAIPLSPVSGTPLDHYPSLVDTTLLQSYGNGSVNRSNVTRIRVANLETGLPISVEVSEISGATIAQNLSAFVDKYGQQTIPFANRVTTDSQLTAQAAIDLQLPDTYPYSSDAYGGVAGTGGPPTGRWSTAKQNGKWYILDPSGNRFFSAGVVGAGGSCVSYAHDRESYFQPGALQPIGGPFAEHYKTYPDPNGVMTTGFNFYTANLERKFGSNWAVTGPQNIAKRMRNWGLNTMGPLSQFDSSSMAKTPAIILNGTYANIPTINGDMPDVYDPLWKTSTSARLVTELSKIALDDTYLGVFVDNELPWAQQRDRTNYKYFLAFSVLAAPSSQPAKTKLISNLTIKYRTVARLNASWGTSYSSWQAMQSSRTFAPLFVNAQMAADMAKFQSDFATYYFSTIRSIIKASSFKGLYLGCRFLFFNQETVDAAKRYCDVVSFNSYEPSPETYHPELKAMDAPAMISEVGFGANDLGRVCSWNPTILVESDRIKIFQGYMDNAATWNNLVGIHWYKWEDDVASGRFFDNAIHCLGLVSVTDMPYQGLVDAVRQKTTVMHNRLLNP